MFVIGGRIVQHVVYCTGTLNAAAAGRWEPDHDAVSRAALSAETLTATP
jgi:hypothetical protein